MQQFVTPDEHANCSHIMCYRGVRCSQTPRILKALDDLHDHTWMRPAGIIIEIGTLYGAFTQVLRDHDVSEKATIHTFDIQDYVATRPTGERMQRYLGNVFLDQLPNVVALIKQPERAFVFCDGGDKEREVNVLCQHLKPGDLILCHDYVKDPNDLSDHDLTGGWPGFESQYANVKDALSQNDCIPFAEDAMRRAMWGCFVKRVR
jgi:hypothetical protein